jgi:hypothetical protein
MQHVRGGEAVSEKLLPCPFCSNDVNDDEGCFRSGQQYEVRCGNPNCFAHDPCRVKASEGQQTRYSIIYRPSQNTTAEQQIAPEMHQEKRAKMNVKSYSCLAPRTMAKSTQGVRMRVAAVLLAFLSAPAQANLCESESMVLEQVVHHKTIQTLTGSVFYYDTITVPNALRLRTLTDGLGGETDYVIRWEYVIDEIWDPVNTCSLYLRYDIDGVMRDGFAGNRE